MCVKMHVNVWVCPRQTMRAHVCVCMCMFKCVKSLVKSMVKSLRLVPHFLFLVLLLHFTSPSVHHHSSSSFVWSDRRRSADCRLQISSRFVQFNFFKRQTFKFNFIFQCIFSLCTVSFSSSISNSNFQAFAFKV